MNEFQARSRGLTSRHGLLIQETFPLTDLEPRMVEDSTERVEVEERRSYREDLARWPLRWRERWGRRANALEDQGLSWRAAELRAFAEVRAQQHEKAEASRGRSLAVRSSA